MFNFNLRSLGKYDVAVCGGGIAGVSAAVAAARKGAKVVLIETYSSLGGTVTEGHMGNIMEGKNKGGIIAEIYDFLNERQLTCALRGPKVDENGKKIPGRLIDTEGAKYFFEKICEEAGVKVLYYSMVAGVKMKDKKIESVMITTYCGNYEIEAEVFIDATGNGNLSALCGLKWECGNPPNPASISIAVGGMPEDFNGTDSVADKDTYAKMLSDNGISVSAEQVTVKKNPVLTRWTMGFNFEYDVMPEDIERYTKAICDARKEAFEMIEAHKKIEGYENVSLHTTASYLGVREGRRIFGKYRISLDDIVEGKRHEDGICLVTIGVDLHKIKADDTTDCQRGIKTKPYHIPYRALVPLGCDNLLLAGRCLSGDFYPFASYRMIGNMSSTGEAAGYAAYLSVKNKIKPEEVDGKEVRKYMESLGHELEDAECIKNPE